jgi:hypothetical protein
MNGFMKLFISKKEQRRRAQFERYQREDQAAFDTRMNAIMRIANENMKKAELGRGLPVKDHVVVPYDDLLKIWDIAENAKFITPVQRAYK